jgi:hypothetical protein
MKLNKYLAGLMVFLVSASLLACGKGSTSESGGTPSTSVVAVSLTDAPGDFDHVWITVKDIWFHTSDVADPGPQGSGWQKFPLTAPKTIDLLSLGNGGVRSIWDGIILPAGTYQPIRVVLVDTNDPLTASATTANNGATLKYNNEVVVNGTEYPLHVPDARHGIRLVGVFRATEGGTLRLAIDFDAGHDVVEFRQGTEYVLKPRLAYFDLDHAGAIVGKLSTSGTFTAARFVVKAERLDSNGTNTYHVVRRWTVPKSDGTFVLYPVSTLVTSTWDIVIRGLEHQTVIITGVPVTRGADPASGATDLGTITMTPATAPDYSVDSAIASPTGAWVQFYQTLPGDPAPYEIRFRHFHPLTGAVTGFPLSNMPLSVGTYTSGPITFSTVTPQENVGGYKAVADAVLYNPSAPVAVSAPTGTTTASISFPALTVTSPYQGNSISGTISMTQPLRMDNKMDKGVLFAVHGGMIVSAMDVSGSMATGGTATMINLPGGTAGSPLPGAFYGIEALGWSSTNSLYKAIAIPQAVDLRTGNDSADMAMVPLW